MSVAGLAGARMNWLSDFALLRPIWLVGLLLIAALALLVRKRRTGLGDWEQAIDPDLMEAMRALGRVPEVGREMRYQLPLWAAALTTLALAGPAMERRDAASFRNLDGVVFVVDVSTSMIEDPLWAQVVTMGRIGVSTLGSKPGALIVYGGDAYEASALTTDTRQIGLTIALLEPQIVPDTGSRPELALQRAATILRDAKIVAGDVVLFTDGGGIVDEALAQARAITALGGRLSVVYAPTEKGEARAAAESLAKLGGGRVFDLDAGNALGDMLGGGGAERLERQDYLLLFWADYGRYLLLLALLPLLGLFRRRVA